MGRYEESTAKSPVWSNGYHLVRGHSFNKNTFLVIEMFNYDAKPKNSVCQAWCLFPVFTDTGCVHYYPPTHLPLSRP